MAATVVETAKMVIEKCSADPEDMLYSQVSEMIEGVVLNSFEQGLKLGLLNFEDGSLEPHLQTYIDTLKEFGAFVDAWAETKAKNPGVEMEQLFTEQLGMDFQRLSMALTDASQRVGQNIPGC